MVGLEVSSDGNSIGGLQIVHFSGAGILLAGKHNTIGGDPSIAKGPIGQGSLSSSNNDGTQANENGERWRSRLTLQS